MKNVYIAAPMFSKAELHYNEEVAKAIEQLGYSVFLPQRTGYKMVDLLEYMSPHDAKRKIFDKDFNAVKESDIIVVILDGRCIDEGACVELGIGFALGKSCYGLKTDPRTMMNGHINPMVSECLIDIYASIDELLKVLREVCYE